MNPIVSGGVGHLPSHLAAFEWTWTPDAAFIGQLIMAIATVLVLIWFVRLVRRVSKLGWLEFGGWAALSFGLAGAAWCEIALDLREVRPLVHLAEAFACTILGALLVIIARLGQPGA